MIKSVRLSVHRNLAGFDLNPGISSEKRQEVEDALVEAFNRLSGGLSGEYKTLDELKDYERTKFIKGQVLKKGADLVGNNSDWPNGRGILSNSDESLQIVVNQED